MRPEREIAVSGRSAHQQGMAGGHDFFKQGDTSFGTFYPRHYIIAGYSNFEAAHAAEIAFATSGIDACDVRAASGDFVVNHLEAHRELANIRDAGWLQRTLVRATGCEDSESDFLEDDAELADQGGAFLFLFAPSDGHVVHALAIFAQHRPRSHADTWTPRSSGSWRRCTARSSEPRPSALHHIFAIVSASIPVRRRAMGNTPGISRVVFGLSRRPATLLLAALFAALLSACGATAPRGRAPSATATPRMPRHVFVIVLENQSYRVTFGSDSPAPYLAHELPKQGALLTHYYGIGHWSLDNYLAMISGQAPNSATQQDCEVFSDFVRAAPGFDADGQVRGTGCVYPADVQTLANQLQDAGFTWKGYMEDMGADPTREAAACAHPRIGVKDLTGKATAKDQYADKHNPFIYFHSIIDDHANCAAHVVNLKQLPRDLQSIASTPNFAFITPDLCHDGHNAPCKTGEPGGLVSADQFIREWVPRITASPAFQQDGLLIITFDESAFADVNGPDIAACCGETHPQGSPEPGLQGPGGGLIGAVVLSPFVAPQTVSNVPYNHYSLLRSTEDWFGLPHLGYAGQQGLRPFGSDILNRDHQATAAEAKP